MFSFSHNLTTEMFFLVVFFCTAQKNKYLNLGTFEQIWSLSRLNLTTRVSSPHQVLFTGVVDQAGEKVLARLGGCMAKGVADMTCLVTDKVRRTVKFLCALAKGVPIVTTDWLEKVSGVSLPWTHGVCVRNALTTLLLVCLVVWKGWELPADCGLPRQGSRAGEKV